MRHDTYAGGDIGAGEPVCLGRELLEVCFRQVVGGVSQVHLGGKDRDRTGRGRTGTEQAGEERAQAEGKERVARM